MSPATLTPAPRVLGGGRYDVLGLVGSGTAADVVRVRERRTGALHAAKLLKPENAANPRILARFEDEFRILRTLHHPHLPEVYDYAWTEDGGRVLVMELVDGVALDQYFREHPADIWAILYELSEALAFVHNRKLLHQDIKPSNILVKRSTAYGPELPLVKLIDFGLVFKRDGGGAVELVGTPDYMAPEVIRGDPSLTRAVDYYSLGATLYELLAGRPPFTGAPSEVLRAHLGKVPVFDEEELEWAELYPHVRALLTKDWRARLEAFEELRRAVTARLTGGIDELQRAYKLAHADLAASEKKEWGADLERWLGLIDRPGSMDSNEVPALEIRGRRGSARSRLLDTVSAECAVRGLHIVRFGGEAGSGILDVEGPGTRRVAQFDKVIAGLEEIHANAVLVVVDGIEQLGDDEAGFLRYFSTKRELATGKLTPVLFVIARGRGVGEHPLDPYLPPTRQSIEIRTGATPSESEDREEHVRALVVASAVFEGARSEARRKLIAYAALHPVAVPMDWVASFTASNAADLAADVDQFRTRRLLSQVVVDGVEALLATDDARAIASSVVPKETQDRIHRDLVGRLARCADARRAHSSQHERIAYHQFALGDQRETLASRIRAVRAAWREGSLSNVERISRESLEAPALKSVHGKAARRHFVKEWVRALWSRNQHAHARTVIDVNLVARGEAIPPSLLSKYIRGTMDADGPAAGLKVLEQSSTRRWSARVREQLALERSLLLHHGAKYDESNQILDDLERGNVLSTKDRHRACIYRAMNLSAEGRHDQVEELLGKTARRALADGCHDEFVLMSAIRAQTETLLGRPQEALAIIATTLRVATRNGLYFRQNVLYRLAATAYQDLALPLKALVAQRKAIALASSLGMPQFEAMSWARMSEYEVSLGNVGNGFRYIAKASAMMGETSYELDRASLQLVRLGLHWWLMSPEMEDEIRRSSWIQRTSEINQRGRYFMILGNYYTDRCEWKIAESHYSSADDLLRRAGFVDNQISLERARLRLSLQSGAVKRAAALCRGLTRKDLAVADSMNGQLERVLALLEFNYQQRGRPDVIESLSNQCLELANAATDARLRLEAYSVVFRSLSRNGRRAEADAVFSTFWSMLKSVTSNLGARHVAGLMERLEVSQLVDEYRYLTKRNEAGVSASPGPNAP